MISFSRAAYDALVDHACAGRPEEVCGVLGGTRGEETTVSTVRRTSNVATRPSFEYEIAPTEQFDAMQSIESAGESVVGFYHSHPSGPPPPSATDRAKATWNGYSYVIVVLDGAHPYVGSWRWTGETFEQEIVRLRPPTDE